MIMDNFHDMNYCSDKHNDTYLLNVAEKLFAKLPSEVLLA